MKLQLPKSTFNCYGGGCEYSPLFALVEMSDEDFGQGLTSITMTLHHRSKLPFSKQSANKSLKPLYDEFEQKLSGLPRRRFLRKKGALNLDVLAEFASAEETEEAEESGEILIDWLPNVLELLVSEMQHCRKKFKSSDDFQIDKFIDFLSGLHDKLPNTKKAARKMDSEWFEYATQEQKERSPWDKLGIDFGDYHHSAKLVVNDPRLWSLGHDFSPNGNDNGADLLTIFRRQKSRIKKNGGHAFLKKMARDWGFDVECEPNDSIEYRIKREVVVGLAFAFMKSYSYCPAWLLELTSHVVNEYKGFLKTNHLDWDHREEFLEYQELILKCLETCPVEPI